MESGCDTGWALSFEGVIHKTECQRAPNWKMTQEKQISLSFSQITSQQASAQRVCSSHLTHQKNIRYKIPAWLDGCCCTTLCTVTHTSRVKLLPTGSRIYFFRPLVISPVFLLAPLLMQQRCRNYFVRCFVQKRDCLIARHCQMKTGVFIGWNLKKKDAFTCKEEWYRLFNMCERKSRDSWGMKPVSQTSCWGDHRQSQVT